MKGCNFRVEKAFCLPSSSPTVLSKWVDESHSTDCWIRSCKESCRWEYVILIGSTANQLRTSHEEVLNGLKKVGAVEIGQVPVLTCEAVRLPEPQVRMELQARNLFTDKSNPRRKVLLQDKRLENDVEASVEAEVQELHQPCLSP